MSTKLGELTVSATPSPAPNPFANWVLPAPRSPKRQSDVAGLRDGREARTEGPHRVGVGDREVEGGRARRGGGRWTRRHRRAQT